MATGPTRAEAKQHRQEQKAAEKAAKAEINLRKQQQKDADKAAKLEADRAKKEHRDAEKARRHKDKEDKKRHKKHHYDDNQTYDTNTTSRPASPKKQDLCECEDGTVVKKKGSIAACVNHGGVKRCY